MRKTSCDGSIKEIYTLENDARVRQHGGRGFAEHLFTCA